MSDSSSLLKMVPPYESTAAKGKTAVLFYGMLRNFEVGSQSIKRHMLYAENTDVFFFGPCDTDNPDVNYTVGLMDKDGFFIENPKEKFQHTEQADTAKFLEIYKDYVREFKFHDLSFSQFEEISLNLRPREDWLMGLNPARMISMFYNMGGVIDMFLEHVGDSLGSYDKIIITRTDLVLYSRIDCTLSNHEIHIPFGEGFGPNGEMYRGNAGVLYYKNMLTGDYSPGGRIENFNDQIMVISERDLIGLKNLFETAISLIRDGAPLSPETILYLVCKRRNLAIHTHDEWNYEIYREGKRHVLSVLDTPDLANIDRYHPSLRKKAEDLPIKTSSDILNTVQNDLDRLRKNILLNPFLIGKDLRSLSNEKLVSFILRSRKRFVNVVKKSLIQNIAQQGVKIYSLFTNEMRSPCAIQIGRKGIILPQIACHGIYGPYIHLDPGHYTAEFVFDEIEGDHAILEVSSPQNIQIAEKKIKITGNTVISIEWDLKEPHGELEVRLFTSPGFKGIFEYLLIKKH